MAEFNGATPEFERLQAELEAERAARVTAEERVRRLEARLDELTGDVSVAAPALDMLHLAAEAPPPTQPEVPAELELWLVQAQLVAEAMETTPVLIPGAALHMPLMMPATTPEAEVPEALKSAKLAVEAAEARAAHNAQQVKKLTEELAEARAEQMRTASRLRQLTDRLDRVEQAPSDERGATSAELPAQQDLRFDLPAPPWAPELLEDHPVDATADDPTFATDFEPIPALEEADLVQPEATTAEDEDPIAAALEEWQAEVDQEPAAPHHDTEWAMDAPESIEQESQSPAEPAVDSDFDLAGALQDWGAEPGEPAIQETVEDLTRALENWGAESDPDANAGLVLEGHDLHLDAGDDAPGAEAEHDSDDALARAWEGFGEDLPGQETRQTDDDRSIAIDFGGIDIAFDDSADAAVAERREAERLEAERLEAERLEAERLEAERLEAERLEAERLEAERLEAERLEAERLEAERLEAERLEAERLEAERLEAERLEAERLEAERLEAERLEAERLEAERLEAERLEAERLEAERLEAERLEAERLEAERIEAERLEAERLEAERLEAERLEAERLEAERLETERLEAERLEAESEEAVSEALPTEDTEENFDFDALDARLTQAVEEELAVEVDEPDLPPEVQEPAYWEEDEAEPATAWTASSDVMDTEPEAPAREENDARAEVIPPPTPAGRQDMRDKLAAWGGLHKGKTAAKARPASRRMPAPTEATEAPRAEPAPLPQQPPARAKRDARRAEKGKDAMVDALLRFIGPKDNE
jgi:hypothetical protein